MTHVNNFVERKCKDCGQTYEVRIDKQNTLYGEYCVLCFNNNCIQHIDGTARLKTEAEKEKDLSYKDELQGITHRGKHRVPK